MNLLTGSWELCTNGIEGKLFIESVDTDGTVRGSIDNDKVIGLWSETAQRLSFMRLPEDVGQLQTYTGYLFRIQDSEPSMGSIDMLTGSFEEFQAGKATAERSEFGWFARIRRPL